MRIYSVLMTLALFSMLLIGLQLSALPASEPAIEAEVNIQPQVFNLKRRGVITAYVCNLTEEELSYDVLDINTSTIRLYHQEQLVTEPLRSTVENDTLTVKFDASIVADYIWSRIYHMGSIPPQQNYTITFTVSGRLFNNKQFAGSDTIKITHEPS
jgi:hypothetical protein